MPLTFPLPLATFWDRLKVTSVQWAPMRGKNLAERGDGEILTSARGTALWRGTATLADAYHADAAEIEALLSLLDLGGSSASFLAYDPRKPSLAAGGTGSATLGSISTDRREISLDGFTGGITPGDLFAFTYGSNPTRYALHRAVTGASNSEAFEVVPPIRMGAALGTPVTYEKPAAKFILAPEPSYGSGRPLITAGASFSLLQTLR